MTYEQPTTNTGMTDEQPSAETPEGDAKEANDEAAEKMNEDLAKGYRGTVPDERPNSDYSLQSGPDAPPPAPDDRTRNEQPIAPV